MHRPEDAQRGAFGRAITQVNHEERGEQRRGCNERSRCPAERAEAAALDDHPGNRCADRAATVMLSA